MFNIISTCTLFTVLHLHNIICAGFYFHRNQKLTTVLRKSNPMALIVTQSDCTNIVQEQIVIHSLHITRLIS